MNPARWGDNSGASLEPETRQVISMWDIHPSQTLRGCDVTKAGTVARPKGGHPEGERNATRNPQIKHSHQRQQTLIATTLCADFNYLATNPSLV